VIVNSKYTKNIRWYVYNTNGFGNSLLSVENNKYGGTPTPNH